MRADNKYLDFLFLLLLAIIIVGLPYGIRTYDRQVWQKKIEPGSKEFTLTGHTKRGWLLGEVHALDVLSIGQPHTRSSHCRYRGFGHEPRRGHDQHSDGTIRGLE